MLKKFIKPAYQKKIFSIYRNIKTYTICFFKPSRLNAHREDPENITICKKLFYDESIFIIMIQVYDEFINLTVETEEMEDKVISIAQGNGWICTRRHNRTINIEPIKMKEVPISFLFGNLTFYHVSMSIHRQSILRSGILPTDGGNTILNRKYSSRVHIFSNLSNALGFVNYQTKPLRGKKTDDIDIYRVTIIPGTIFYKDYLVPDCGLWTTNSFPPSQINLIEKKEWRHIYDVLYPQ